MVERIEQQDLNNNSDIDESLEDSWGSYKAPSSVDSDFSGSALDQGSDSISGDENEEDTAENIINLFSADEELEENWTDVESDSQMVNWFYRAREIQNKFVEIKNLLK